LQLLSANGSPVTADLTWRIQTRRSTVVLGDHAVDIGKECRMEACARHQAAARRSKYFSEEWARRKLKCRFWENSALRSVPNRIVHRTRTPDRAVILMVESTAIVPTGDV
jgi:hypothetical protein